MIIHLITILCSLCIQFVAIDFPIDYSVVNSQYQSIYDACISNIGGLDSKYGILIDRSGGAGTSYGFFYPVETIDGGNSIISVSNRTSTNINIITVNWYRWLCNSDGYPISGPAIVNIGTVGFVDDGNFTQFENIVYNSYYALPFDGVDTFYFSKNNEHLPPTDLDPSGKNDKPVDDTVLQSPGTSFTNNGLNSIFNLLNGVYNNIVSGFNGVFYYFQDIGGIISDGFGALGDSIFSAIGNFFAFPSSDELSAFFNDTKIVGDLYNTFSAQYNLFNDFYYDWTINNNDDFVIDLQFQFLSQTVGGSFSMRQIFGNSLKSVRDVTSVFIYLGSALFVLRAFPSILGNTSVVDGTDYSGGHGVGFH